MYLYIVSREAEKCENTSCGRFHTGFYLFAPRLKISYNDDTDTRICYPQKLVAILIIVVGYASLYVASSLDGHGCNQINTMIYPFRHIYVSMNTQ